MVTLNYDRKLTAFVVGDTPFRLTPDATSLNNWATNVALAVEDNDDGAVSKDEYLGMYYPSGFTSDNAGNNVVVPASHMALRTIVLNDQVAYPWYAPAGSRRGGVSNASAAGYINAEGEFVSIALNAGQRDVLYSNSINPITPVAGAGLLVFGQKTRARSASALDRVNVARLTVYLRRQLEILARPYLFEPNDAATRSQVKAAADALLLELVNLRALYDFVTVCDTTNNTTARIDRNELYLDIAIEPVKSIEFIYIPLRIKNTGEIAALG
jgi:phage tail sheath protein FI